MSGRAVHESEAATLLSIGIPTFNRRDAVTQVVQSASGCAPIVVVDDGSTDGTASALSSLPGVRLVRHTENKGYASAYLRLFAECATEYLLVTTDDDLIQPQAVHRLEELLRQERPDFVATTWIDGGTRIARAEGLRPMHHHEFFASKHAPGLVYRIESAREALAALQRAIAAGEEAAHVYPQTVVLAAMLAGGADCRWSELVPVRQGLELPSGIRMLSGEDYHAYRSQLQLRASFSRMGLPRLRLTGCLVGHAAMAA